MRVLYFDCFAGISGDMTLGALIDCGIDFEAFKAELSKLNIDGYSIELKKSIKNGISGTNIDVVLHEEHENHVEHGEFGANHLHGHLQENHEHTHNHGHEHEHCHEGEEHQHSENVHMHHGHRNLSDIENIIDASTISDNAKNTAKKIFRNLAVAEAKIHGKPVEDVHFHEVGAVDSIVDIVGAAICFDMLKVDKFICSPVNTGMGFVKCQHGIIPIPGPAALELLKGVPVYSLDINTELVTPTGAAILSTMCTEFGPIPSMVVEKTGYGCGKKDLEIPNMLRLMIGEVKKKMK